MKTGRPPSLSDKERALIVEWSAAGIGLAEQARRLGRPVTNLQATYRTLVREGTVPKRVRPTWRTWTPMELDYFQSLIDQGHSYDAIARKLGRTRTAIVIKAKRIHHRVLTTSATITAREAAQLLGARCPKTVVRWITKWKWLKGRNAGTKQKPIWSIQLLDFYAFLEKPECWMAWHPDRVTEAALREYCQELRAGKPRWLTPGEVAQRLHVQRNAVNAWIHKGYLPSVRYGNHWISEADLVGFVPPCEWDRVVWRKHRKTLLEAA